MAIMSEPSRRNSCGFRVIGDTTPPTPRWWVVLWFTWGILVSALILLQDHLPVLAGAWTIGGAMVGLFGLTLLEHLSVPFMWWYERFFGNDERRRLLSTLIRDGKTDTEECRRLMDDKLFSMSLAVPPVAGLFYGTLLGAIVGALCGLDSDYGVAASAGAALGMLLGPVFLAFGAAITLACVAVGRGTRLSWRERLARRGLLVVSPLLIVPCIWYCLRTLIRQRQAELR